MVVYLPDGTIPMPKSGGTFTGAVNVENSVYQLLFSGGTISQWSGGASDISLTALNTRDLILNANNTGKSVLLKVFGATKMTIGNTLVTNESKLYQKNNIYFDNNLGIDFQNDGTSTIVYNTTPAGITIKDDGRVAIDSPYLRPLTDDGTTLGSTNYRWLDGFFTDIHYDGTLYNSDLYFNDMHCIKCGAAFIDGDDLTLKVLSVDGVLATVPIHLECSYLPKIKKTVRVKKIKNVKELVKGEIVERQNTVTKKTVKIIKQIKNKQVCTGTKFVQNMQTVQIFDTETGLIKNIEVPKTKKRLKTRYNMDGYGDVTAYQDFIEVPDEYEVPVYQSVPVAVLDLNGKWKDENGNILTDDEALEDVEKEISEVVYIEKEIEI